MNPGSEKIQIVPGNPDASIKGSAATALTGYKFVGWYKGNTPVSAAAQLDPGSEKIQIVPGNPDASIKGSAATALTGYKFVGWYKGNTPVSAAAQLGAKSIKDALNKDANGNYAATTFTAKFDYDETALATVTYVSEDAKKGTVDNGSDTIQIRTGEPLSGSKAAATAGYQFDGWYKGDDKIADSAVLSAADAKKALDTNENR